MLIFVDCEARGTSPVSGTLTEFGCVSYPKLQTFHGQLYESSPDPANPAIPIVGKRLNSDAVIAGQLGRKAASVIREVGGQFVIVPADPVPVPA